MPLTLSQEFDLEAYMSKINVDDSLRIVLAGHLYVEAVLTALIEAVIPYPDDLPVRTQSFTRKLGLARALGILHPSEEPAYRALNDLRNDMAHGLPPYVSVGQVATIIDALGEDQRAAIRPATKDGEIRAGRDLQTVLIALFVLSNRGTSRHPSLNRCP